MERHVVGPAPMGRWSSYLEYCDLGFTPSDDAKLDLVRLGALCGRSNGLVEVSAFAPQTSALEQAATLWSARLRGKAEAPTCGRLAVGVAGDGAIAVELRGGPKHDVLAGCRLSTSGFCPPRSLVCNASELRVSRELESQPTLQLAPAKDALVEAGNALTVRMEWWGLPSIPVVSLPRSSE